MSDITIAFEDLRDFRKALRSISKDLPKELRLTLKAAMKAAAEAAERLYDRRYQSHSGRTRGSIREQATQTAAGVAFGGARYPWVPGQEFGSNKFAQFSPWTGRPPGGGGSAGRFIFEAVREEAEPVAKDIMERFSALARQAYPEP